MKLRTLWDEPLGMLMASGSPGSALAYQLGQAEFDSEMVRRNTATQTPVNPGGATETQSKKVASGAPSARGWLGRVFERLELWAWEREVREREAYLSQAQDLYDLEVRMRHLDGDEFSRRGRALR